MREAAEEPASMLVWNAQTRLVNTHGCSAQEALDALEAWANTDQRSVAEVARTIVERAQTQADANWLVQWLAVGTIMAQRHFTADAATQVLHRTAALEHRSIVEMSEAIVRSYYSSRRS